MIKIDFNKLLHSATYYLSYQDRVGRNFMIDESSLKYPIADYLTGLEFPLNRIKLEYPHPEFLKRSIDLVTTDASGDGIENAFEFKRAKNSTKYESEQNRIFHDLIRLYLISELGGNGYFLMAGPLADFIQNFQSIPEARPTGYSKKLPDPEGVFTEWFRYEVGKEQKFVVNNASKLNYIKIYQSYLDEYKPIDATKSLSLPDQIRTECLAISVISTDYPTPYVGAIWQVT
ncbi:hypothetical protein [Mucilaginibacter sp. PAMB04168]|uniref:hypothetical protein n=1 Tax=Mucilaginibacter sp. PAMB04168 TaxID=3138567 RepID=UPI0031F61530